MKPLAFVVLAVLLGFVPITIPDVLAQPSAGSTTDKPAHSSARSTQPAATAGPPHESTPKPGRWYLTGGPGAPG